MSDRIDLKGVRASLPVRGEPHWRRLGVGCAIGYRKSITGGSWIARWTDAEYNYHQKKLGSVDDVSYEDAVAAANTWFAQCRGGVIRAGTVADACNAYVANLRSEKGEKAAEYAEKLVFKNLVYDQPLGARKLDALTTRDVLTWRDGLLTKARQKNSANRALRSLKAALSFAYRIGMCPSDGAWRRVERFKGKDAADGARTIYLNATQRKRLLDECDEDTANLLRGLLYTAARPLSSSELPVAKVSDFDEKRKSLTLRTYKGDGTERKREVPLSDAAVTFFKRMAKNKLPGAFLFTCEGLPWERHLWADGIKAALIKANEKIEEPADRLPQDTCAYTMRHCAISERLQAGVNVSRVAKDAGTSVGMIERYYAKFIDDQDLRDKLNSIQSF